jgi:hypothetical protein
MPPAIHINEEWLRLQVELGRRSKWLSEQVGCSAKHIQRTCRRLGIDFMAVICDEELCNIIEAFSKGHGYSGIGMLLGLLKGAGIWGIVINKRRLNKVTLNKVSTRQHVKHLRRFYSTVAV